MQYENKDQSNDGLLVNYKIKSVPYTWINVKPEEENK